MRKEYILPLFYLLCLPLTAFGQSLKFIEKDGAITLYEQEELRFSYQKETKAINGQYPRANYVHPVFGLNGEVLTEDFPEDHLHHRGIFWTWHQLYVNDQRIADPWFCEGISWEVDTVFTKSDDQTATLEAVVYWVSTQSIDQDIERDTILQEHVKIEYTRQTPDYYELDFKIALVPLLEGVEIGGSEDEKGYGGFSVRLKTPEGLTFHSEEGKVIPQNTPVEAGAWVDVKGLHNTGKDNRSGVIMMADPGELENFQGWILRKKDSMQNPAFPGREPIALSKENPLVFKNKLIVYQKSLSIPDIEKEYLEFSGKL